jgi:murein DD-endopeptidase MepM/ murein hydrolase activator NlpD
MKLLWPIDNIREFAPIAPTQLDIYISQNFGRDTYFTRDTVINGRTYLKGSSLYAQYGLKGHNGLDIACPMGTPVRASYDGKIDFVKDGDGYGNNARLTFNADGFDWEVIYGHLLRYEGVERQVRAGEIIAYADSTGFSTASHLHFGLRKYLNGSVVDYSNGYLGYIDPIPYLRRRMSNAKLVKIGNELGYWYPVISGDGLKSQAANVGEILPEKPDRSVDWDKIKPDYSI